MTEEEAKTKWCPFVRVYQRTPFSDGGASETGSNRWADDEATHVDDQSGTQFGSNCIGSACMAWRWFNDPTGPQDPDGPEPDMRGFCGLASKP